MRHVKSGDEEETRDHTMVNQQVARRLSEEAKVKEVIKPGSRTNRAELRAVKKGKPNPPWHSSFNKLDAVIFFAFSL